MNGAGSSTNVYNTSEISSTVQNAVAITYVENNTMNLNESASYAGMNYMDLDASAGSSKNVDNASEKNSAGPNAASIIEIESDAALKTTNHGCEYQYN